MNLDLQSIKKILPRRPVDSNKGSFGKVLVVAGSAEFPGAAALVCESAYRAGAGLVTLAAGRDVCAFAAAKLTELVYIHLLEENLEKRAGDFDAVAIGPGLGQKSEAQKLVKDILAFGNLPKSVIDADALNILATIDLWWEKFHFQGVLTPHPKEMSRLTGLSVEDIQANREQSAAKFSKLWDKVLVLKGANTVIASPSGEVRVSPFANPLLATAGTGDVLAGVIAAFAAQGLDLFSAACAGVFAHGQAGDLLKETFGQSGMLATDLLNILPDAINKIRS